MVPLCKYLLLIFLPILSFSVDTSIVSNSPTILIAKGEDQASIQIVYMAKSKNSADSHIQTLASVLGSEMEAKKAIIYDYTRTINGFAAELTTDQNTALLKQPGVLKIVTSEFQNVAADVSSSSVP